MNATLSKGHEYTMQADYIRILPLIRRGELNIVRSRCTAAPFRPYNGNCIPPDALTYANLRSSSVRPPSLVLFSVHCGQAGRGIHVYPSFIINWRSNDETMVSSLGCAELPRHHQHAEVLVKSHFAGWGGDRSRCVAASPNNEDKWRVPALF